MKPARKIIEIDQERCDGCGQCILACAEGALEIVDGKARLVGELFCDGLGACLGECPQDALHIVERPADAFDEEAVHERLKGLNQAPAHGPAPSCPSAAAMTLDPNASQAAPQAGASTLGHWPIKLQLLGPNAPFLKGSDLVLTADCAAAAYPGLHQNILPGRVAALGCPKLDDLEAHINRLADILREAKPKSLTVLHMEVPCCKGFVFAAQQALMRSGMDIPTKRMEISRSGAIIAEEPIAPLKQVQNLSMANI